MRSPFFPFPYRFFRAGKPPQAFRRVFTFCTIRPRQDSGTCTKAICKFFGKTVHFFAPIAGVFKNGYCLTTLHVPELAANAVTNLTSNPILIALLLNLILLVLGCIMDMAPIILIATPILLPIATSIGIDPIQFGIMVVLNCGIGLLTPPVGAVLFIGSAVAKRPMEKVVKATLPFYLCMIIALLLITFIPDISLFIPKLCGYVPSVTPAWF